MKDFYDLWVLACDFPFSGQIIASAIQNTFNRRRTPLPTRTPEAFQASFKAEIIDERFKGDRINAEFIGTLRPEQQVAADALLGHDTGLLAASTAFGKTLAAQLI